MLYVIVFFHLAVMLNKPVVSNVIQLARELGVIVLLVIGLHNGVPLFVLVVQSSTLITNECVSLELL